MTNEPTHPPMTRPPSPTAAAEGILRAAMQNGLRTPAELAAAAHATGILFSPETAKAIAAAARAQVVDQVRAAVRDVWTPADLLALLDKLAGDPTEITVYRAEYYGAGVVLGTYLTAGPARDHCETTVRREHPAGDDLTFDWLPDDEDEPAVWELYARVPGDPAEIDTGYAVAVVDVATSYDPDGDE